MIDDHYNLELAARGLDDLTPQQALAILALSDHDRAGFEHSVLRRLEEAQEHGCLVAEQPEPAQDTSGPTCWSKVISDFRAYSNDTVDHNLLEQVVEDMKARDQVGRERYGTPLRPDNGRDALVDAYQELLDFTVYLAQAQMELDRHIEQEHRRGGRTLFTASLFLREISEIYERALELLPRIRDNI